MHPTPDHPVLTPSVHVPPTAPTTAPPRRSCYGLRRAVQAMGCRPLFLWESLSTLFKFKFLSRWLRRG